jgi:hypothetical protein
MVTSHVDRTSPVVRGKWVLDNLLSAPVPPMPNNVPPLNEDPNRAGRILTLHALVGLGIEALQQAHPGDAGEGDRHGLDCIERSAIVATLRRSGKASWRDSGSL